MHIVCLCGSTRHPTAFAAAQRAETLAGNIVVSPVIFSHVDRQALSHGEIEQLHLLHREKIELADEVVVVSADGRVGESTAQEIAHAEALNKPVRFWVGEASTAPLDPIDALVESHRAQRLVANETPTLEVPAEVKALRCSLIEEEAREFREALAADDIVEVADAIGDLLYVVYGAALTFGIPASEVFSEVHRSNMTKLGADGEPLLRADGKMLKGPNYSPPDLRPILRAAGFSY